MRRKITLALGALALASLVSTSSAEAQSAEHFKSSPTRITGYLAVNVCCEASLIDTDDGDQVLGPNLDPGVGFGIRVERRVADWLAIGGLFELMAAKVDGWDDRFHFIDVDLFAKALYEVELSGSMGLELYGLVPFGFSGGFDDDDGFWGDSSGFGLNTGLLGGAMLLIDSVGIVVEMGFRHRSVWDEQNFIGDVRLSVTQFAMNFGASVAF